MSGKVITRAQYEHSELDDPRLPRNQKSWLNARTGLVRKAIRQLRREGIEIPVHNSEFVIACAAPFRYSTTVTTTEVREMVIQMTTLFEKEFSKNKKPEISLQVA